MVINLINYFLPLINYICLIDCYILEINQIFALLYKSIHRLIILIIYIFLLFLRYHLLLHYIRTQSLKQPNLRTQLLKQPISILVPVIVIKTMALLELAYFHKH